MNTNNKWLIFVNDDIGSPVKGKDGEPMEFHSHTEANRYAQGDTMCKLCGYELVILDKCPSKK